MNVHPRAGQLPEPSMLANIPRLVTAYFTEVPDPDVATQRVSFGTSGHRGSSLTASFNERHILATTQAICLYRTQQRIDGPLFLGIDTHALSECAVASALEVLAANEVEVMIDARGGYAPTPAVSLAILTYNRGRTQGFADGIVVTPSHNPPEDGGFKYNPPNGGPADSGATQWIQDQANALLAHDLRGVKRVTFARARAAGTTHQYDYLDAYVKELERVIDLGAIRGASVKLGVDPLGGAGVAYWSAIADRYKLPLTVISEEVDPTFRFVSLDWDGRIRMDCSSPYAMQRLIALRERFDVAWACDTDHDRHGIVAQSVGLLNPNHYLSVASAYLFAHRPEWLASAGIGKTVVSGARSSRRGAHRRHRKGSWRALSRAHSGARRSVLRAHRCARDAGAEGGARQALAARRVRRGACRRAHREPHHHGPRQRSADRRPEGRDALGMVRRSPVGHRERLQAVC